MHGRGSGVSLAELGSLSVFVDHVSEESMTSVGVSSRVTVMGSWGDGWCRGLSARRLRDPDRQKVVDVAPVCQARSQPPVAEGDSRLARHNPISLAVANPPKRDAETSSPPETIGRPIGEAAAGPDRPVPSTCVNANNTRVGEGCAPTWLETPGEFRSPVSRAAPSGAIPSERGLGRDVAG
jgi:hypothetical protein